MSKKSKKQIKACSTTFAPIVAPYLNYSKAARECILNKLMKDSSPENIQKICDHYKISQYRLSRWRQMQEEQVVQRGYSQRVLTNEQENDLEQQILERCKYLKRQIRTWELRQFAKSIFSDVKNFRASNHWALRFARDKDLFRKINLTLVESGIITEQQFYQDQEKMIQRKVELEERLERRIEKLKAKTKTETDLKVQKIKVQTKLQQKQEQANQIESQKNQVQELHEKPTDNIQQKIEFGQEVEEHKSDNQISNSKTTQPSLPTKPHHDLAKNKMRTKRKLTKLDDLEKQQQNDEPKDSIDKPTQNKVKQETSNEEEKYFYDQNTKYTLQDIEKFYKAAQDQLMMAQQKFIQIQTAFYKLRLESNENIK